MIALAISRETAVLRCYSPFLAIIFSALSFWYFNVKLISPSYSDCYWFLINSLAFRTVEILWNLLEFGSKQEVRIHYFNGKSYV